MKVQRGRLFGLVALAGVLAAAGGCYVDASVFKKQLELPPAAGAEPERTPIYEDGGWIIARASLHNHTVSSDGKYEPEDLLELARRQGMAVLAFTDHREGKICLGKLLCVQTGGVEKIGYDAYWERLEPVQAEAQAQHMIATRGVEVSSPYIANNGKFPYLVLRGQYNHFTVYDVRDPTILDNMPASREIHLRPDPIPDYTAYQDFVDYLTSHGAIVHAVHVESGQDDWIGTVHVVTPPPTNNLMLRHLTGFSILPEGWHEHAGGPGGLWDTALIEYLAGMREAPLWANADADFHGPHGNLANATTLLYMREFSEDEVYRCMREGRMVALMGEAFQDVYVKEWNVSDGTPANAVMLGEQVKVNGAPTVKFALNRPVDGCRTRLVRNGRVVLEAPGTELTFVDSEQGAKREPAYYRVEVTGPRHEGYEAYESAAAADSELFVNPIFVRYAESK